MAMPRGRGAEQFDLFNRPPKEPSNDTPTATPEIPATSTIEKRTLPESAPLELRRRANDNDDEKDVFIPEPVPYALAKKVIGRIPLPPGSKPKRRT